jgi:hypothetical protein
MRILLVRAPPGKRFPGRVAQVVDHPYKCRSGTQDHAISAVLAPRRSALTVRQARGARFGQSACVIKVELTLYATTETIDTADLRAYWKADDAPAVDAAIERAPSVRLGTTYVIEPGNENLRGPVGRVEDVLQRFGTRTWPPERLPVLDDEQALLAAFKPQAGDPPFDAAPIADIEAFLDRHRGAGLAYRDALTE